jgi:outer membrane murein-binding lipoprotein Lpp
MPPRTSLQTPSPRPDTTLQFSVSTFIAYTVVAISIGASVLTLINTVPKIDKLSDQCVSMDKATAVLQAKVDQMVSDINRADGKK